MSCNGNCGSCGGCSGGCGSCGGCARDLVISRQELTFLQELGQVAFLPVARSMGEMTPVYLEDGPEHREEMALLLQILEKKGLISMDYDKPLKGFDMGAYKGYPVHGSIALTQRGQQVLTLLEYQGYEE